MKKDGIDPYWIRDLFNEPQPIDPSIKKSIDRDFAEFAVIRGIAKNKELQHFNLKDAKLRAGALYENGGNYLKVKVVENWGGERNIFHRFSVFGFVCK